jgi:hypothetical protein
MNTKNFAATALSTLILLAALIAGAGFGSLTNAPAPAQAETPTATVVVETGSCGLLCLGAGSGGVTP